VKRESIQWKKLRPFLVTAKLDPVRVENPICPGTPDVNLASGDWIELKTIEDWPRDGLQVKIPHFTPQQRVWLYKRWRVAPGTTHLVLEVRAAKQWLLFDGDVAAKIVGRATEAEHKEKARGITWAWEIEKLTRMIVERRGN